MATVTEMESGKAQPNLTAFKAQYGDAAGLKAYQSALSTWRSNTSVTRPIDTTPDTKVKLTGSDTSATTGEIDEPASPIATADSTANQDLIDTGKAKTADLATELGIQSWTDLSDDEKADFISASGLNTEELKAMGMSDEYIQNLGESAFKLEQAQGQVGATNVSNSSLYFLQRALQKVSGVGSQDIGTSKLYEAAGLPTSMATLSPSLQQRANEMSALYDKYNFTTGQIAQAQVDTYNAALTNYGMVKDEWDKATAYVQGLEQRAWESQNEMDMYIKKSEYDASVASSKPSKLTYNEALSEQFGLLTFVDEYGNMTFVDETTSSAEGDIVATGYTGAYGGNCALYVEEIYPQMPTGLNTKEERQSWVNNYGFTLSERTPQVNDVVQTLEGDVGHTAIIRGFTEDGKMILEESNYRAGVATIGRELALNSPWVIGFWSPNAEEIKSVAGEAEGTKLPTTKIDDSASVNPSGAETFTTAPAEYTDTSLKTGSGGTAAINYINEAISLQGYATESDYEDAKLLLQNSADEDTFNNWYLNAGGKDLIQEDLTADDILTSQEMLDTLKTDVSGNKLNPTEIAQAVTDLVPNISDTDLTAIMKKLGYTWDSKKLIWK